MDTNLLSYFITAAVSITASILGAFLLDRQKEIKRHNELKENAYRILFEKLSSNNEKNNEFLDEIERILKDNEKYFDPEFRKLLPSTLEFNAYWCVRSLLSKQENSAKVYLTCRDKKSNMVTCIIEAGHRPHPEIYVWFKDDAEKDKWKEIANFALKHYNSLARTSRTVEDWKLASFSSIDCSHISNSSG